MSPPDRDRDHEESQGGGPAGERTFYDSLRARMAEAASGERLAVLEERVNTLASRVREGNDERRREHRDLDAKIDRLGTDLGGQIKGLSLTKETVGQWGAIWKFVQPVILASTLIFLGYLASTVRDRVDPPGQRSPAAAGVEGGE